MEDAEDLQAQQTAITHLIKMRGTEVLKTPSLAKSIMADFTRNKQKDAVAAFYTVLEEMNSGKSFSDEKAARKFLSMIENACRENGLEIPRKIIAAKEKIKVIVPEDDTTQRTETQENTVEPQAENKAEPKTTQPQATPQVAKKSNAGVIGIIVIAAVFLGYMFVIKPQQEAKRIAETQRLEAQRTAEMQRLEAQRKEETKQKTAEFLRSLGGNEHADAVMKSGINAKDNEGWTALIVAAATNNTDVAKLLIQAGADLNAKKDDGFTALMYAAGMNSTDVAKLLIQAGADLNAKKDDGFTALMVAAANNSQDIAQLLINAKADINARDNGGFTALVFAEYQGYTQMAQMLRNAGATY